jgi:hypothetical protein
MELRQTSRRAVPVFLVAASILILVDQVHRRPA